MINYYNNNNVLQLAVDYYNLNQFENVTFSYCGKIWHCIDDFRTLIFHEKIGKLWGYLWKYGKNKMF